MKNTKPTSIVAAVATLMLSGAALGATDDMGMQYTSASEGLSGSFRVNLYHAKDDGTDDTVKGAELESLRLNFAGSVDLGNGMSSSYAMELRSTPQGTGEPEADMPNKINLGGSYVENYHIGLEGAFGNLQFGRIAAAGFMIPGGSLDSMMGNSRKSPVSDPGDGTFKYTSPSINGFQFGFSAVLNDEGMHAGTRTTPYNGSTLDVSDDMLDEVSFAAVYDSPVGLQIGAAYDKAAKTNDAAYTDDITGYRVGAHYGQDNWTVAYEFRKYDNFRGLEAPSATCACGGDGSTLNDYSVHAFGVRFILDKVTTSANYSVEEVTFNGLNSRSTNDPAVDLERTKLGVDLQYALGSKSSILLGFSSEEEEQTGDAISALGQSKDTDVTTLRYQVDF